MRNKRERYLKMVGRPLIQKEPLPIMCIYKGIEADRRQCQATQLHAISQVLENRMFDFYWPEIEWKRNVIHNHKMLYQENRKIQIPVKRHIS